MKNANTKGFFQKVYSVVKKIPAGRVSTYGAVAAMAGSPRMAKYVGYALHVNPEPGVIPCHRVVNRNGEVSSAFAFGGGNRQKELLEREGVTFTEGKVNLEQYFWTE